MTSDETVSVSFSVLFCTKFSKYLLKSLCLYHQPPLTLFLSFFVFVASPPSFPFLSVTKKMTDLCSGVLCFFPHHSFCLRCLKQHLVLSCQLLWSCHLKCSAPWQTGPCPYPSPHGNCQIWRNRTHYQTSSGALSTDISNDHWSNESIGSCSVQLRDDSRDAWISDLASGVYHFFAI